MTYQEYFSQAEFNEVWKTLRNIYGESEDSRPLYQALFESVSKMKNDKSHSAPTIEAYRTESGEVYIDVAPDPQEWLVAREVKTNFKIENISDFVAHLLYWSTLYGIKTLKMQEEDFSKWHSAFNDMTYEEERRRIRRINAESSKRKKLRFWKSTIINDTAYDWSENFTILRKKLEYNIGYNRFTQIYVGWEKDVERMALACRLMKIANGEDPIYDTDIYVNPNNCSRFNIDPSDFKKGPDFTEMKKDDLRKEKAYRLVWTVLQKDMKNWWN